MDSDSEIEVESNEGNEDNEEKKSDDKKSDSKHKKNTKKGPGRPRKTPKKEPIPRKGISKVATNIDDCVELVYDQPVIFKKIFQFFKSIAANQIQILFRKTDIIMYAVDHHAKSKIRIRVDASKLNHYYCSDTLDIGVSTKEMEQLFNKIDRDYLNVIIVSSIHTMQRNISIVFENTMDIDEIHTIELISNYSKMENESAFIDMNYMISFQFPSKFFKKTVTDIKSIAPQLSIIQTDPESSVMFGYLTENKRIQSKHVIKNKDKVKLVSKLTGDNTFRVDVRIEYIKPISSAQIADFISILVDENKALMTESFIDGKTIEIKTLTEIVDERPTD